MKKIQRVFCWVLVSTFAFSAQAQGFNPNAMSPTPYQMRQYPNLGSLQQGNSYQGNSLQGNSLQGNSLQGDSTQSDLKNQIDENKKEIILLKTDIREINSDIRVLSKGSSNCDCRASCEADIFAKLGVAQSSNSCHGLWQADRSLNSLSSSCRRAVLVCRTVEREIARSETEDRIREIQEENRELERDYRRSRSERRVVVRANEECVECQARYRPSTWEGIIGTIGALTPAGLGLMGMSMYNRQVDAYYGAYRGALNAYNTNVSSMYDHYTTLGIPAPMVGQFPAPAFFGQQSMGLSGWLGSPYMMMNGGGFNPYMGIGFNAGGFPNGFNNGFYNGYSPFGVNAMFNGGITPYSNSYFNPMMNPYGSNGYSPFGLNGGWSPYNMGASAAQWPYQMGANASMYPFMGFNNGMNMGFGMGNSFNPMLGGGGFPGAGWGMNPWNNGGMNMGFGMQNPWMYQQYGMMQAQSNLQAASYRYNQVMQQSSPWGAMGGFNSNPYGYGFGNNGFGAQFGLGLNFGLNFGAQWP